MARATRATWAKRIEDWRQSGLATDDFAAKIGVNSNTLRNWKYKLGAGEQPDRVDFIEVAAAAAVALDYEPVEVVLGSGVRMRVPSRFDGESLGRLVSILERR